MHWGDGGPPAEGVDVDIRNNVLHNCGNETFFHLWTNLEGPTEDQCDIAPFVRASFVGNTMSRGPNSHTGAVAMFALGCEVFAHMADHHFPDTATRDYAQTPDWAMPNLAAEHPMPAVTTEEASAARAAVLAQAGAWPRDAMNIRTISQVNDGSGQLASIDDALITTGPMAPVDTDRDGMPDVWEVTHGSDPQASDHAGDVDGDGWTNIEEWLHERAQALIAAS